MYPLTRSTSRNRFWRNGNGTSAWTPAALGPALALWLDAADASTITLNGGTVSQWNDKSGNARHVSQATAVNQPTYNTTALNGKPSLVFDGTDDFIANTATGIAATANVSLFMVTTARQNPGNYRGFFSSSPLGGSDYTSGLVMDQGGIATTALNYIGVEGAKGGTNTDLMTGSIPFGQPTLLALAYETAETRLRVNGGQFQGTRSTSGSNVSLDLIHLGVRYWFGAVQSNTHASINLSDVVLVVGAMSTTDRERLEGYLAWKWGLEANLPAGHPFESRPPTV